MDALGWFAMALTALVAQWFNRFKHVPAPTIKAGLAVVGLAFYALGHGLPAAWYGPELSQWLDPALLWAMAVPGMASLVGAIPGMETNSK